MGAKIGNRNSVIHGKSGTRLYRIWKSMRIRCNCPTSPPYKNYGGRGIRICDEWNDFENFYEWAYANGYDETAEYMQCTLDRIDVNGNYEPNNCRFANWKVQSSNKRSNVKVVYKERTIPLPQLSEMVGIPRNLLYDRIIRSGWSVERAVLTPVKRKTNGS